MSSYEQSLARAADQTLAALFREMDERDRRDRIVHDRMARRWMWRTALASAIAFTVGGALGTLIGGML